MGAVIALSPGQNPSLEAETVLALVAVTEGFHSRQGESPWQGKSPWQALPREMLPAPTAGLQLHSDFIHTHLGDEDIAPEGLGSSSPQHWGSTAAVSSVPAR